MLNRKEGNSLSLGINKWWKFIMVVILATFVAAPTVAQEVEVTAEVAALSGYVWRGDAVGEKNNLVIQPEVRLGFSTLTVGAWGSAHIQNRDANKSVDEVNVFAYHTFDLHSFDVNIGGQHYLYPSDSDIEGASEVFVDITTDLPLGLGATVYYNFGDWGYDWYTTLSGGFDVPVSEYVTIDVDISVSGSDYGDGGILEDIGFSDASVSASLPVTIGGLSLSPGIQYTYQDGGDEHWIGMVVIAIR